MFRTCFHVCVFRIVFHIDIGWWRPWPKLSHCLFRILQIQMLQSAIWFGHAFILPVSDVSCLHCHYHESFTEGRWQPWSCKITSSVLDNNILLWNNNKGCYCCNFHAELVSGTCACRCPSLVTTRTKFIVIVDCHVTYFPHRADGSHNILHSQLRISIA